MADSTRKKFLDAALKSLLAIADTQWYIKGAGTMISELSSKFGDLPEEEKAALAGVDAEELKQALSQIGFATSHSAEAAAGVYRIEEQLKEVGQAIQEIAETYRGEDRQQDTSQQKPGAAMGHAEIRKALTNLSEADFATLIGESEHDNRWCLDQVNRWEWDDQS